MKRADLVVGEFYALGQPPTEYARRVDLWREEGVRVRVVALQGELPRRNGTTERGILIEFPEAAEWRYRRVAAGEQRIVGNARVLLEPWETFAKAREEQRERGRRRHLVEQEMLDDDRACLALAERLGVHIRAHRGTVAVTTAVMQALLDEIVTARA